jgi:HPt (histidine-containing phosphotransfer) domain-containing protein
MGKHYSRESLNEIAGGDEEFMAIVAKAFLEEIPPDLKSMTEALENENKDLAYQFAHKMKPNLEMFGIPLNKDVTAIENWTKTSKSKETIMRHLETITTTLEEVFKELKTDFL